MPKNKTKAGKQLWKKLSTIGVILAIPASIAAFSGYSIKDLFSKKATEKTLSLTVFIHGPLGPQHIIVENQGKVILDLSNNRRHGDIGKKGETYFNEIPQKFHKQRVPLFVDVPGFNMKNSDSTYQINGEPIYLEIQPDDQDRVIQGKVLSRTTLEFIQGATVEINGHYGKSDSLGNFYFLIPESLRSNKYDIYISKDGFTLLRDRYYPRLGFAEFQITENQEERE